MPLATYTAIFFCACKSCFTLRKAIRGIVLWVIHFAARASFFLALLGSAPRDMALFQMLSYVLIVTALDWLLPVDSLDSKNAMWAQSAMALSPLCPYAFQPAFHAMLFGRCTGKFFTVVLPAVILSGFLFGMPVPVDFAHGALALLQAMAGFLLCCQILFLVVTLSRMKRRAPSHCKGYLQAAMLVFGGTMAPLWLYPDFLQTICMFLPFRFCAFEAVNGYIGSISVAQALLALGATLLWTLILGLTGQALFRGFEKKSLILGR